MNSSEEEQDANIGLGSPSWMARAIAFLAPANLMYRGFDGMLRHMEQSDETSMFTVLDHFVQCTVNGVWTDPYGGEEPDGSVEEKTARGPITEDEIQQFLRALGSTDE